MCGVRMMNGGLRRGAYGAERALRRRSRGLAGARPSTTAGTSAKRRRQGTARIEDEQIARADIIPDFIETRVLDLSGRTIDHEQTHLIARDAPTLRWFFRAEFRWKREGKRRVHLKLLVIPSEAEESR